MSEMVLVTASVAMHVAFPGKKTYWCVEKRHWR